MSQYDGISPHHSGQSCIQPETVQTMSPQEDHMMHEHPNQSFDWTHSIFECSASDIEKAFDFDNLTTSERVPYSKINDIQYSRLLSPRVRHAPYTVPQRHRPFPHQVAEQSEGRSQSAAHCDLSPSPVLDVPPPALAPAAPAPVPAQVVGFGLADLSKVKAAALFQMKRSVFSTSFLPKDDSVTKTMATNCLNAQVCHSAELAAWATTKAGQDEITKMCNTLIMIRKNMQFLTRSAVLWGYGLHQLLDTEEKEAIKEFVDNLLKNDAFLRGVIKVNGKDVDIPFGNLAMWYYLRQLLFHDRQYRHFIGNERNLQPLYTYTSVLFKWVLTELSSGAFKDLDFKIIDAIMDHDNMVKLFKTLTTKQRDALTASVFS
ncbi:hypothetical protein BD769DRAFT_1388856 [Suillus cothurnatus]|nr:hypothetical protein BD769DRAFT_1388856 [Suillus cothurnatus]